MVAVEQDGTHEGTNPSTGGEEGLTAAQGEREDGTPRVLREPQDEREEAAEDERNGAPGDPSIRSQEGATRGERKPRGERKARGERDDGAPLNPSIPQDERRKRLISGARVAMSGVSVRCVEVGSFW